MADITSYSNSSPVDASCRFLGTDADGNTKNFLASDIATYTTGTAPGTVVTTTSTAYTLTIAETNNALFVGSASATAITIPLNASVAFPIGTKIIIMNGHTSSANVTVSITGGGTLSYLSTNNVFGQYGSRTIVKVATDTWFLY